MCEAQLSFSQTSSGMIPMATMEGNIAMATKTASYHHSRWLCSSTLMRATYRAQEAKTKQDIPCLTGPGSVGASLRSREGIVPISSPLNLVWNQVESNSEVPLENLISK